VYGKYFLLVFGRSFKFGAHKKDKFVYGKYLLLHARVDHIENKI
jgi:hypothetical protein